MRQAPSGCGAPAGPPFSLGGIPTGLSILARRRALRGVRGPGPTRRDAENRGSPNPPNAVQFSEGRSRGMSPSPGPHGTPSLKTATLTRSVSRRRSPAERVVLPGWGPPSRGNRSFCLLQGRGRCVFKSLRAGKPVGGIDATIMGENDKSPLLHHSPKLPLRSDSFLLIIWMWIPFLSTLLSDLSE